MFMKTPYYKLSMAHFVIIGTIILAPLFIIPH